MPLDHPSSSVRRPPSQGTSFSAVRHLLLRYHNHGDRAARDEVVERLMPLVRRVAKTYPYREHADDLHQVACLGLVKAIDRWDPSQDRGSFTSYAVPTMLGEVRRFVRDHTWTVRPPRGLQERVLATSRAAERLTTRLGRAPTPQEIATEMDLPLEEVLEGLQAGQAHGGVSLDAPLRHDESDERRTLGETFGTDDPNLELAEDLASLGPLMASLTKQERSVVTMRFRHDMVQSDIARRIGVSQMQVSRLLRGALSKLRRQADEATRLSPAA